jgi:putative membrane protein
MWWSDWFGSYAPMPWMFFGPVMVVMFFGVCVAIAFLVMRAAGAGPRNGSRALEILKERYARGEIDQAEFEERRRIVEA